MNLIKYDESANQNANTPQGTVQTLEGFNQMLNEEPPANEVELYNGSRYIPISFIQMLLDKFFIGLWEVKNFKYMVIANEIVGNVTLRYYHPFAKVWVEREGAAAVMIQLAKGAHVTDIGSKIKNTLGKDHPHLLASCIASAAKTIGKRFGRDLNRKLEDTYQSLYTDIANAESAAETIEWDKVDTIEKLTEIWKANKPMQSNKQFQKLFSYHKTRIATNAKKAA